jgi:hypothetical protein
MKPERLTHGKKLYFSLMVLIFLTASISHNWKVRWQKFYERERIFDSINEGATTSLELHVRL